MEWALWVWTFSSIAGMLVSGYALREARRDVAAVHGLTNGRRLVARQRLFAQTIRLGAFAAWLSAGIIAYPAYVVTVLVSTNVAYLVLAASDAYVGYRLREGSKNVNHGPGI